MTNIDTAIETLPTDLQETVRQSLLVPQFGPYHNEGAFLRFHLELVLERAEEVARGEFLPEVPEAIRPVLLRAAMRFAKLVPTYVLLHDMAKGDCLSVSYSDHDEAVSWNGWQQLLLKNGIAMDDGPAINRFLQETGVTQISYYQQDCGDGHSRKHGPMAADSLTGREDIPELVVEAIRMHELAFQFGSKGGINIPLYRKAFEGWQTGQVKFALLVNYLDQAGSLGEDDTPSIGDFVLLARTHLAALAMTELEERIDRTERLQRHLVERELASLMKATDAFQAESVDQAYERIVAQCIIPSFEEVALQRELHPLMENGQLDPKTAKDLIEVLLTTGLIPKDFGKKLGKANKAVRDAVARAAS